VEAVVPYAHTELVARAHREGEVLKEDYRPEGTFLAANLRRETFEPLRPYALTDPWAAEIGDD
jgi:GTP-binding protein HflX